MASGECRLWLASDERQRMQTEVIAPWFEVLSRNLPGGTEEHQEVPLPGYLAFGAEI